MDQLSRSFLADALRREPTPAESRALVTTYVRQWNDGVRYRPDTPAILAKLAERFTLAVVSNRHEAELVSAHIAAMGIGNYFDTVLTSVEFGWRKPHPSIYAKALDRLGIHASRAVFVGDTYDADFAGPEAAGIRAYLIDPAHAHDIPADHRLDSLADLPARLLDFAVLAAGMQRCGVLADLPGPKPPVQLVVERFGSKSGVASAHAGPGSPGPACASRQLPDRLRGSAVTVTATSVVSGITRSSTTKRTV